MSCWMVPPFANKNLGFWFLAPIPLYKYSFVPVVFAWKCCHFHMPTSVICHIYYIPHVKFYFRFYNTDTPPLEIRLPDDNKETTLFFGNLRTKCANIKLKGQIYYFIGSLPTTTIRLHLIVDKFDHPVMVSLMNWGVYWGLIYLFDVS